MSGRIDIVATLYDEQDCVEELVARLSRMMSAETAHEWRVILVENGSSDATWELVQDSCSRDARFLGLRLARNFGTDGGLTAGLSVVDADAVVLMAGDLQDPPEFIPDLVAAWEQGAMNVYAEVTRRRGTGPLRRFTSWGFYRVADLMTGGRLPRNASDFRLMDRSLYEVVRAMDERNRFLRGLVAWAGFPTVGLPLERPPRFAGESKAYSLRMIGMAVRAILAHSYVPLRLMTVFGVLVSLGSVVALAVNAYIAVSRGVPFAGFGTLVSLLLLVMGTVAMMLGIMAEYLSLIYEEVKRRPNFIIAKRTGS